MRNLGDKVKWQTRAYYDEHEGKIVAVIPAGECPEQYITAAAHEQRCQPIREPGKARSHVSYLVHEPSKGRGAGKLFWPPAGKLR